MGQFSWLDCVSGKPILDGVSKTSYVLVPKKFGGGHIAEHCYDGYGNFGGYDIYDLVADWNKKYIDPETSGDVPKLEDYGGLWSFEIDNLRKQGYTEQQIQEADLAAQNEHYQDALRRAGNSVNRLIDFCSGKFTDAQMAKKYGRDFKREIGIDIACGDDKNFALPYPIKITYHPDVTYEECNPSPDDPNQGWGGPEPAEMFYGISATLPAGVKFNKSAIAKLVKKAFGTEATEFSYLNIRDAKELRIDEGFDDPYDEEAIEYYPDDVFSITVNCTLADSDVDQYVASQIYDVFEDAGYTIDDVYYETE